VTPLHVSTDGVRTVCGLVLAQVDVRYFPPKRAQHATCKNCLRSLRS
jgi:hypothetical protein